MLRDEFKHLNSRIGINLPGEKPEQTLDRLRDRETKLKGEIKERQGQLEQLQVEIKQLFELHPKLSEENSLYKLMRRRRENFPS